MKPRLQCNALGPGQGTAANSRPRENPRAWGPASPTPPTRPTPARGHPAAGSRPGRGRRARRACPPRGPPGSSWPRSSPRRRRVLPPGPPGLGAGSAANNSRGGPGAPEAGPSAGRATSGDAAGATFRALRPPGGEVQAFAHARCDVTRRRVRNTWALFGSREAPPPRSSFPVGRCSGGCQGFQVGSSGLVDRTVSF